MPSILPFLLLLFFIPPSLSSLTPQPYTNLPHPHNGSLLPNGNITLHIVWYGAFPSPKRAVILDFLQSLSSDDLPPPSVSSWWHTIFTHHSTKPTILLGNQIFHPQNGKGKTLTDHDLRAAAADMAAGSPESLTVVLTAKDVTVEGFCLNRCGTQGLMEEGRNKRRVIYTWVGNAEKQCPGYCSWPFYRPVYGPQGPPLVPPNGDVGVDGMVINLATVMATALTRHYGGGEEATVCAGVFGEGAYPGYAGEVKVDVVTGGSFNGRGVHGRSFLLPAMWDRFTSACVTQW